MECRSVVVGCLFLLLWGGVAEAATVKLDVPTGTFSARFLYENAKGFPGVASCGAAKDGSTLDVPREAAADIVLMVANEETGNAARVALGRPPKEDVELRLTDDDFSWVETAEVRVTGQPDLQPVSGALVLIRRDGTPEFAWVAETTADGLARLGPVPSGNLIVDVWAQDRAPASEFITIERERPAKSVEIAIPLSAAGAAVAPEGVQPPEGGDSPAVPAAPLPTKILVGLLGLIALVFFGRLWVFIQAQEASREAPLGPTRPDRPFGVALIGPAIVIAFISGLAGAISAVAAGGAERATPFLLAMLGQIGFALVAFLGVRGRNDALAGFGASALTAAFLAPLALAQMWAGDADGTRLLAVILNVVGAVVGLGILVMAVAALDRIRIAPPTPAPAEGPALEPAICPYCGDPIDEATGTCSCETPAPSVAPQPVLGQPVLMGIRGKYAGVEFALQDDGPTRIGRDPANEIALDDATVSRKHAQLEREAEGIVLTDLGSSNGTFVNGRRVERAVLSPGDEVAVGDSAFRLQVLG